MGAVDRNDDGARRRGAMTSVAGLLGAAALALLPAATAQAMVSFDSTFTDIECGIRSAAGTVPADCATPSFQASITAGQTAFLSATLQYHYTDDGLPLPRPSFVQGDKFGFQMIPVFNEVGALYPQRNDCYRLCPFPPSLLVSGTPWQAILLGHNEVPDDITGSLPIFVEIGMPPGLGGGWSGTLTVGAFFRPFAAPVPEPATWALIGAGLLAGALRTRSRRGTD